jgi:hypothetical protein
MTYSKLKLNQVATLCGSTVSGVFLGQLLADPRFSRHQIAAALSTTPAYFEVVMAEPEPTVYPPSDNPERRSDHIQRKRYRI